MVLVKRSEFNGSGMIGAFEMVGKFSGIREVRRYAMEHCKGRATGCLYLCQTLACPGKSSQAVLVLDSRKGKVKLNEMVWERADGQQSPEFMIREFLYGLGWPSINVIGSVSK